MMQRTSGADPSGRRATRRIAAAQAVHPAPRPPSISAEPAARLLPDRAIAPPPVWTPPSGFSFFHDSELSPLPDDSSWPQDSGFSRSALLPVEEPLSSLSATTAARAPPPV
ncbi:hypothetical protein NKH18_04860 [Streptomyces sp. M10(2022)]